MRRIRAAAALLVGAMALGACSEDSTGPDAEAGTVRFAYHGAESGAFDVTGRAPLGGGLAPGTWAVAIGMPGPVDEPAVMLLASRKRSGVTADVFAIGFLAPEVGTTTCGEDDLTVLCSFYAYLAFEQTAQRSIAEDVYELVSGRVTVTDVNDDRIQGSFELLLRDRVTGREVRVQGGSFDVPRETPEIGPAASTWMAARMGAGLAGVTAGD